MENQSARPFWAAFFLTIWLIATAIGMLTVDYRCRTMISPADSAPAAFQFDSTADGEGMLYFRWFDTEGELILRPGERLRGLFGAMPVLIPRPLRAAALLDLIPETKKTEAKTSVFLFEYLSDIAGPEKADVGADQPGEGDVIDKEDRIEQQ